MLTLHLKREWFDKIKSGEKTHEYRKYDYWYPIIVKKYKKAKLENRSLKLCFMLGYNIKPEQRVERIIYAEVIKISVLWGDGHKIDDNIPTPVVDIEFSLIKGSKNASQKMD